MSINPPGAWRVTLCVTPRAALVRLYLISVRGERLWAFSARIARDSRCTFLHPEVFRGCTVLPVRMLRTVKQG